MGALRAAITDKLEAAEASGDALRASTLRLIQCALRDRDMTARAGDRCAGCDEPEIVDLISTMLRQRELSARAYDEAGRPELAERERDEIAILTELLPQVMGEAELRAAAGRIVDELDATGLKDIGRCLGALKSRYAGQVDPIAAGRVVKDLLS